jgi:hypothetical protein
MAKVLAIDVGTTNSCMAVIEGGEPSVLENSEGTRTTPSVVAFTKTGDRLVGEAPNGQAVTNSRNTIDSVKRFMGRKFEEVQEEIKRVPYKVARAANGDAAVEVEAVLESAPESERWDPVPGSTGHKVAMAPSEDEDDEGRSDDERLVEEGVAEAELDQRRRAAKIAL